MRQRPSQSQIPSTSITANPRDIGQFLLAGRRLGWHRGPPRQTVELNIRIEEAHNLPVVSPRMKGCCPWLGAVRLLTAR